MKSLLLVCLLVSSASFAASTMNVDALNSKLKKENAGWTAKENWLTQMAPQDVKRMMGLRQDPAPEVEFIVPTQRRSREALPASFDWRNKDGKNWVSPVLNQANCGSCVAFASIGVMETQLNISSLVPNLNVKLSPQNLFSCGGGACEMGWMPGAAAEFLMKTGVTDEACMPYLSGSTGEDVACNAACPDAQQRTFKLSNYTTPSRSARDVDSVKQALLKGPVVTTLAVYGDFIAYAGGVYKHNTGDMLGGHAISIIGYDDASQSYIVRNSWGPDWGENGFGHVAYDDVSGVGGETWGFETPATQGAVAVLNPRDYNALAGTLDLQATSNYNNTDSIQLSVYDGTNKSVWSATCKADCSASFNSTQLADGRYEIQATAFDSKGAKIDSSVRQFFYVANAKPDLALSFTGHGFDMAQPLKDRVVFDITAHSSTVPMTALEFHYKDASGTDKVKHVDITMEKMTLGWRTNFVPNGTYEIWMVGHLTTNQGSQTIESAHVNVTTQN